MDIFEASVLCCHGMVEGEAKRLLECISFFIKVVSISLAWSLRCLTSQPLEACIVMPIKRPLYWIC